MNTKTYLIIFGSSFALMMVSAIIGNILESNGTLSQEKLGPRGITAVTIAYLALFCVMAFAIVPARRTILHRYAGEDRQWKFFSHKIVSGARAGSGPRLLGHDGNRDLHNVFPGQG